MVYHMYPSQPPLFHAVPLKCPQNYTLQCTYCMHDAGALTAYSFSPHSQLQVHGMIVSLYKNQCSSACVTLPLSSEQLYSWNETQPLWVHSVSSYTLQTLLSMTTDVRSVQEAKSGHHIQFHVSTFTYCELFKEKFLSVKKPINSTTKPQNKLQ